MGKVDHVTLGQLRIGLARITVERKVLRPRRLTNHQHEQSRLGAAFPGRPQMRVFAHLGFWLIGPPAASPGVADQRDDHVARRDEVAHLRLIAHQRGEVCKNQQQACRRDDHTRQQPRQAPAQSLAQLAPLQLRPPQQRDRQRRKQHQVRKHAPNQQLARFTDVSGHHIFQHRSIHIDRVAAHVPR